MKQKIYSIILACIVTFSLSASVVQAFDGKGLEDYTVLSPLPGTTNCTNDKIPSAGATGNVGCKTNFQSYLPGLFNFAIGFSAVLAFVMITFGGVMYATSDAIQGKSEGRGYITNAISGLLLVIGAWALLNTISPSILQFNLNIRKPDLDYATPTVLASKLLSDEELKADAEIRQQLKTADIGVNHEACTTGATQGCTNLNDLPQTAVTGLIDLKKSCNCSVTVSGGTEGGHTTHKEGAPIVDLQPSPDLNKYLGNTSPVGGGNPTRITKGNAVYTYENTGDNGRSTAPHWHVVFK